MPSMYAAKLAAMSDDELLAECALRIEAHLRTSGVARLSTRQDADDCMAEACARKGLTTPRDLWAEAVAKVKAGEGG